jgi:hypothetical protein
MWELIEEVLMDAANVVEFSFGLGDDEVGGFEFVDY